MRLHFTCNISAAAARAVVLSFASWLAAGSQAISEDLVQRSRAIYAGLRSYADTGTVTTELKSGGAPTLTENHRFTTYYRAPRHFYFEFNEDKQAGGDRLVIWGDDEAFHRWWSTTGIEETYQRGEGAAAFSTSTYPTKGSALQIPPLLFSKAGLQGALANFVDGEVVGTENVGGRRCHKVAGVTSDTYTATGKEVNVRKTIVWIDAESLLVRKVLEDTPRGSPVDTIMRVTTTFEPKANPSVEDSRFRFTAPSSQQ